MWRNVAKTKIYMVIQNITKIQNITIWRNVPKTKIYMVIQKDFRTKRRKPIRRWTKFRKPKFRRDNLADWQNSKKLRRETIFRNKYGEFQKFQRENIADCRQSADPIRRIYRPIRWRKDKIREFLKPEYLSRN